MRWPNPFGSLWQNASNRFHDWASTQIDTRGCTKRTRQRASGIDRNGGDNLTKFRIRDLVTDAEFLKPRQEIERDQIRIERELAAGRENMFEPTKELISFSNRAAAWLAAGDLRTKRLILTIVSSNPLLKDKKLNMEARKPFLRSESVA